MDLEPNIKHPKVVQSQYVGITELKLPSEQITSLIPYHQVDLSALSTNQLVHWHLKSISKPVACVSKSLVVPLPDIKCLSQPVWHLHWVNKFLNQLLANHQLYHHQLVWPNARQLLRLLIIYNVGGNIRSFGKLSKA